MTTRRLHTLPSPKSNSIASKTGKVLDKLTRPDRLSRAPLLLARSVQLSHQSIDSNVQHVNDIKSSPSAPVNLQEDSIANIIMSIISRHRQVTLYQSPHPISTLSAKYKQTTTPPLQNISRLKRASVTKQNAKGTNCSPPIPNYIRQRNVLSTELVLMQCRSIDIRSCDESKARI
jgi:hypothetical protein